MPNYKVADGHRVAHGEHIHVGGDTVEMSKEDAEPLLKDGTLTAARSAAAPTRAPAAHVRPEDKSEG